MLSAGEEGAVLGKQDEASTPGEAPDAAFPRC